MSASLPSAVPASGATKRLADPATKAWVTEMIAGGDLEGYRSQARATLTFDVRTASARSSPRPRSSTANSTPPPPAAFATFMGQAIPGATVHIMKGQGHFSNLEAPELFNPLLADAVGIPNDLVPARSPKAATWLSQPMPGATPQAVSTAPRPVSPL